MRLIGGDGDAITPGPHALTGGGGNGLLGARFKFDGGGLRLGGKLPRLAELLRPGPLVGGGADRRPPQLAYLPVSTLSRAALAQAAMPRKRVPVMLGNA